MLQVAGKNCSNTSVFIYQKTHNVHLPRLPTSRVCVVCFITACATPIAFRTLCRFATAPTSYVALKQSTVIQRLNRDNHTCYSAGSRVNTILPYY